MNNLLTGLAVLFLSTALVACGGAISSSEKGKGADAGTKTNPLASGKFPDDPLTIHTAAIYSIDDDDGYSFVMKFDPTKETFTMTVDHLGKSYSASGTFDRKTGEMQLTDCDRTDCLPFDFDDTFTIDPPKLLGDGLVLIDRDLYTYFAVSPTDESKMPAGRVTYEGKFYGDYSFYTFGVYDDFEGYFDIEGKATTTVNFDAGQLDAKFHELTYDNVDGKKAKPTNFDLELKGAKITGNRFAGGTAELPIENSAPDPNSKTKGGAIGGFFGENASELGGSIEIQKGDDKGDTGFNGVWTGVAQ